MEYIETNGAYYEFDMNAIRCRIDYLRSLLGTDVALAYAVKANTFLIGDMIGMVERFEICSPGESAICDMLGEQISNRSTQGIMSRMMKVLAFTA